MKSEQIILFAVILVIGYLLYLIMAPFWTPIVWAIVLSILFYPLYDWVKGRLRLGEATASLLACASIVIFLTVPVILIAATLVDEMLGIYAWIETYIKESKLRFHDSPYFLLQYIERVMGKYIDMSTLDIKGIVLKSVQEASNFIIHNLKGIVTNFADFALNLLLTVFAMFYLFKDGDRIVTAVKELLPLSNL